MNTIEKIAYNNLLEETIKQIERNYNCPDWMTNLFPEKSKLTFYVNKAKKTIVCKNTVGDKAKVKLQDGDEWNEYTGMLAAYIKLHKKQGLSLSDISKAKVVHQDAEEATCVDAAEDTAPMPQVEPVKYSKAAEQTPIEKRSGKVPSALKDQRWLAFWLDFNNLSMHEAAQLCGVSFSTIERASQGFFVRPTSFKKIADGLGLSKDEAADFKNSLTKHQRWVY